MKGYILVFVQFSIIGLMLLPLDDKVIYSSFGFFFTLLGLIIGAVAIYTNGVGNFNIRPDIKENSTLITSGIYAYIRHPMYTSVIVAMFGILLLNMNLLNIILYLILICNMLIKMFYEEQLWGCNEERYREYAQNTSRLLPFVF